MAVVRPVDRCRSCHLYTLGQSSPIELGTMIATLADALGKPATLEYLPEQPGDVRQTYADITRARDELGYEPLSTPPFAEGIRRSAWYRSMSP